LVVDDLLAKADFDFVPVPVALFCFSADWDPVDPDD